MKSLAAVCWRVGDPWSVEEIEVDPPGPGEVLVEWVAAGLCHSDENLRSGARVPKGSEDVLFPLLGGHEGAGVVAEVGPGVTGLAVGDHVGDLPRPRSDGAADHFGAEMVDGHDRQIAIPKRRRNDV